MKRLIVYGSLPEYFLDNCCTLCRVVSLSFASRPRRNSHILAASTDSGNDSTFSLCTLLEVQVFPRGSNARNSASMGK